MDREKLQQELIRDEGLRLKPYRCTAGKLTIGVGRNLDDIGINKVEAIMLLNNDIERSIEATRKIVHDFDTLNDTRKRVLVNMCFNLGPWGLKNFRNMLAAVKVRDYARAADEMLDSKWARQVGRRAERLAEMMRDG
jgi:lysozyme